MKRKKLLKTLFILLIITVLLAGLGFGGYYIYNNYVDIIKPLQSTVKVHKDENGYIYTTREWNWRERSQKEPLEYDLSALLDANTKITRLSASNNKFVEITIPDTDVFIDDGKCIWANDGSFYIELSYIGEDEVTPSLFELESITPEYNKETDVYTYVHEDNEVTLIKRVGEYVLRYNIYSNNTHYSILKHSIDNVTGSELIEEVPYAENYLSMDSLRYIGKYTNSVEFKEVTLDSKRYLFEDGVLWLRCELDEFEKVKQLYRVKAFALSNEPIVKEYSSDYIYYAKFGNWHVCCIKYNMNTTIALLGFGSEAECNMYTIASRMNK